MASLFARLSTRKVSKDAIHLMYAGGITSLSVRCRSHKRNSKSNSFDIVIQSSMRCAFSMECTLAWNSSRRLSFALLITFGASSSLSLSLSSASRINRDIGLRGADEAGASPSSLSSSSSSSLSSSLSPPFFVLDFTCVCSSSDSSSSSSEESDSESEIARKNRLDMLGKKVVVGLCGCLCRCPGVFLPLPTPSTVPRE